MTPAIETIRKVGDMLERGMYADDDFAQHFPDYAEVWARYLLPNRDPKQPGFALKEWQELGENHYSTIVRCWNMRRAFTRVRCLCNDFAKEGVNKGVIIAELHGELLNFFAAAGAVTENLDRSFRTIPGGGAETFQSRCKDTDGSFRWFYDRRSQQVHNIIVPLFPYAGSVCFDGELLKAKGSKWEHAKGLEITDVAEAIEVRWNQFVDECRAFWSDLLRLLRGQYPEVQPVRVNLPKEIPDVIFFPQEGEGISGVKGFIPPSGTKLPGNSSEDRE